MIYSIAIALKGSVILPSLVYPISWYILTSGTSNRLLLAVYTVEWSFSATSDVAQHSSSCSAAVIMIHCYFVAN
ncbi:hypothetical protein BRADI_4g36951v3 [Brachypodium distachyon]|uniref:Uncharacterized protein n=1 Tax=Brachypodium distachyon TaxID=15368 RepID=A0A2K2CSR6_BRADI|nr:hypothetical protein BRADI_4g36951v3 [Brachypodium distachyon]